MKPTTQWIEEWIENPDSAGGREIAAELMSVFLDFWHGTGLDTKSRTTRNKYAGCLHALGGYLVGEARSDDTPGKTAGDLLTEHVGPFDGPLIFHDEERWQEDLDLVCRKLHKFLNRKG